MTALTVRIDEEARTIAQCWLNDSAATRAIHVRVRPVLSPHGIRLLIVWHCRDRITHSMDYYTLAHGDSRELALCTLKEIERLSCIE